MSVLKQSVESAVEGRFTLDGEVSVFAGPDNVRLLAERKSAAGKVIPSAFSITASTESGDVCFLNVSSNSRTSFEMVSKAVEEPSRLRFRLVAGLAGDIAETELESGEVLSTPRFRLHYGDFYLASKPVEVMKEDW